MIKSNGEDALTRLIGRVSGRRNSGLSDIHAHENSLDLWHVLSALRGPDTEDNKLKDKYTGPIRAWISEAWNKNAGSSTGSPVFTLDQFRELRNDLRDDREKWQTKIGFAPHTEVQRAYEHYTSHILRALQVIIRVESGAVNIDRMNESL